MKMSISAEAVINNQKDRIQWTVSVRVRSKVISTLTFTEGDPASEHLTLARYLLQAFLKQADIQKAYHFIDEEHPWQEELPF